ncbi:MAG: hypothetical protein IPP29_03160 [Bacteroidetes bacterium]|nr:hypothetical protein [Bacteroidota bacterium]
MLEIYDFDRCTGVISNPVNIHPEKTQGPWPQRWSSAFSPSDSLLYVTQIAAFAPDSCYLKQYNLTTTNIATSAHTLWTTLLCSIWDN